MKLITNTMLFLFVCWSSIGELQSWRLSISHPELVSVDYDEPKTVLCKADPGVTLTGCEFGFENAGDEHYINASLGSQSGEKTVFKDLTVKYHGIGLDKGECGIELKRKPHPKPAGALMSCRGRTENGGWKYNYTTIADPILDTNQTKLHTTPSLPFLLPGSNLTARCDSTDGNSVDWCLFRVPGQGFFTVTKTTKPTPPENVVYSGEGLAKGQCGIFIPNVDSLNTSESNAIECSTRRGREWSHKNTFFLVAAAPVGGPSLSVTSSEYLPNSTMTFICVAPASRPPASIAWYLGDKPVSDGISEESVDKWRWWRDPETTTQTLTLNLTEGDQGRNLRCVMSHVALTANKSATLPIGVGSSSPPKNR